ncbi:MAG: hemerythrin domain-containing protein [Pseudomonadota bacterium]
MAFLEWSDALSLDLPIIDDTHREFVELLAIAQRSTDEDLPESWQQLVDHTAGHFGQEDRWMLATRFSSVNCHTMQHKVVLEVMREGIALAASGDTVALREMASELALWFPQHAQTMDAALALHLRREGYDPATGIVISPANRAAPSEMLITGCGSDTCA